jgi:1-deoxy-D-xylulose-5-phosphate synthase
MASLLENIHSPDDLKKMNEKDIQALATEIRTFIIKVVSENGGHLASNLGVVELTIALHRAFSSPCDKIIWDVGHQSYIHKLLTGRYEHFQTLRTKNGMSGFPKRSESIHDVYETGHSSTSISAALGFAAARDLTSEQNHVVAVIGDGSMTGGLAYEALNNVGHSGKRMIVILNDNNMSISQNVGAMATYFGKIRTAPTYFRLKSDFEYIMRKIPALGEKVINAAERVKDSLKHLVVPGMLFEEMGFTYLGPVNGHNEGELQNVISRAKTIDGPVLIHVLTKKGKGYKPAEDNPDIFHGTGPFNVATGEQNGSSVPLSYTQVFGETIQRLAGENRKIVGITAAMTDGTGMDKLRAKYPDRYFDVGIAEAHAVTFAAGLASAGFRPVVAVYSTFLQRAYDQILMDVCLQNLPVVFAVDRAGVVGEDGETHQGLFDISYLRPMPNMTIMVPKDENELQHMLHTALLHSGPSAIRYPRGKGFGIPLDQTLLPMEIGKAELCHSGKDITIIAAGPAVHWACEAALELETMGKTATVVNARFVKPLDEKLIIESLQDTRMVLVVEENVFFGGLASAVSEMILREGIGDIKFDSLSVPDKFLPHGTRPQLLTEHGISKDGICKKALAMLAEQHNTGKNAAIHLVR